MRLVTPKSLKENDQLSKAVHHENGKILVQARIPLSQRVIRRLVELDVGYVYLEEEDTKDIEINNIISDQTRMEAVGTIKTEFSQISNHYIMGRSLNTLYFSKSFSKVLKNILTDIKKSNNIISILSDVFCHDSYIFTHSLNVTIYALGIGRALGYTEKQLFEIGIGAILHDVGKMMIPNKILAKQGPLSDEEFLIIKGHARAGFDLLRNAPNISLLAAHCAFQHHERLNGTGYPQGLCGGKIHPYAKILAVADVFDAVTSKRVYREALLPHEGLELLYAGAGTLFDINIVEVFSKTIAIYPIGITVYLNDHRKGVVSAQNKFFGMRPIVRILEENGQKVQPYEVDLLKVRNITIIECEARLTAE
ncbi:HD-GYP domain-containing protein [Bacillaceae bacterium IKA-2]|jgi:HD-GYP domain-containing protein (c-di-GMP phosphodiesterase class II)|nr:HD-GYP domain-containing protein [Bacillaceae bacterium IKA-2]